MCKSMNRAEFTAIMKIAKKLGWKSVNFETISQMVRNQQALELDTVGECDDFEETLLSIALWDRDKIISTMYVSDYHSLVNYKYLLFLDSMGITDSDYKAMVDYYVNISSEAMADEEYELAMHDLLDARQNSYC